MSNNLSKALEPMVAIGTLINVKEGEVSAKVGTLVGQPKSAISNDGLIESALHPPNVRLWIDKLRRT